MMLHMAIENHMDNKNEDKIIYSAHHQTLKLCHSPNIKLHRIEVKKFWDDLTKCMAFHKSFKKLVN